MACENFIQELANLKQQRDEIEQELHGDDTSVPKSKLLLQLRNLNIAIGTVQGELNACLEATPPPPTDPGKSLMVPANILQIQYTNPSANFNESDANWAANIAGGVFPLHSGIEWKQVLAPTDEYDGTPLGATGWVVSHDVSGGDFPFSHPFGVDWEFSLLPDQPFNFLLAPGNLNIPLTHYSIDIQRAGNMVAANNNNPKNLPIPLPISGVLGVEFDEGLIPSNFKDNIHDGDRIGIFGRWIVDCGHEPFHTEIHPPLLMASASIQTDSSQSDFTRVLFTSRPYLVSQYYTVSTNDIYDDQASNDGTFFTHVVKEIEKVEELRSQQVEAHPKIKSFPFMGVHIFIFIVQAPALSSNQPPHKLVVSYNFTVRTSCSVEVTPNDASSVKVYIAMNNAGYIAPFLPTRKDRTYSRDDLKTLDSDAGDGYLYTDIFATAVAALIGGAIDAVWVNHVLDKGVKGDEYDPLPNVDILNRQNAATNVDATSIPANVGVNHNDGQPYPVYGWLEAKWVPL